MSLSDRSIYRDLLDHQAAKGSIPNDAQAVANLAMCSPSEAQRFLQNWGNKLFPISQDGRRCNARLADARSAVLERLDKRSRAGQVGALARWGDGKGNNKSNGNRNSKRIAGAMPCASDSGSDSSEGGSARGGDPPGFNRWWKIYPKKRGKARCRQMWIGQKPLNDEKKRDLESVADEIIAATQRQIDAKHWRGADGKDYIHDASTWLYNQMWEDEVGESADLAKPVIDDLSPQEHASLEAETRRLHPELANDPTGTDRFRQAMTQTLKAQQKGNDS